MPRTPPGSPRMACRPVHSFRTLLDNLAKLAYIVCRASRNPDARLVITTRSTSVQEKAFCLLICLWLVKYMAQRWRAVECDRTQSGKVALLRPNEAGVLLCCDYRSENMCRYKWRPFLVKMPPPILSQAAITKSNPDITMMPMNHVTPAGSIFLIRSLPSSQRILRRKDTSMVRWSKRGGLALVIRPSPH